MSNEALRDKNRETVRRFFEVHGPARADLFAKDGAKELPYPVNYGGKMRWEGREGVRHNLTSNKSLFVGWGWSDLEIDDTQDPNKFWVRVTGSGQQAVGDLDNPKTYVNHYVIRFTLRDGEILEMLEYNNPLALLASLGAEMPKVPTPEETDQRLAYKK